MHIQADRIDDLLREVLKLIKKHGRRIEPTKGKATEIDGVLLELTNPRARISKSEKKATIISCLGEFLWYLSSRNDLRFISHYISIYPKYSDDKKTINGAYGPRLFKKKAVSGNINQIKNIINKLSINPDSRQAVIQLFDAEDIERRYNDTPCTCTLQFLVRDGKVNMYANMRSNDIFKGFTHDIFAFTMLQEIISCALDLDVGTYKHFVGSLHLYDSDKDKAEEYLSEGYHSIKSMPIMPKKDLEFNLKQLLTYEIKIRNGVDVDILKLTLEPYWKDLLYILYYYKSPPSTLEEIDSVINSDIYKPYLRSKLPLKNEKNS